MSQLTTTNLTKSFNDDKVVNSVSFSVEKGEIICLLGPSGCGKTTLLRLIAGLEQFDSGEIIFEDNDLSKIPPSKRNFGLMFQNLALFPHMNVFDNIAFGLKMKNVSNQEIHSHVSNLLSIVGLEVYSKRDIYELSGGQQQRVALARAIAPSPTLLMLDEPLGSLDSNLRNSLQIQIRDIVKKIGVTSIYVTHDRDEAISIADKIVLMDNGKIIQIGTPNQVFESPINIFAAEFLGHQNIISGRFQSDSKKISFDCEFGQVILSDKTTSEFKTNTIIIDTRGISLLTEKEVEHVKSTPNLYLCKIIEKSFKGREHEFKIQIKSQILVASMQPNYWGETSALEVGQTAYAKINSEFIYTL